MHHRVHHIVYHSIDFFLLFVVIILGLFGLYYFQHQLVFQVLVAIGMCISYALWGINHHYHEGNLTREVVLEYISISGLTGFILVIFLFRT